MSHFKERHILVRAEGGEGRLPEGWSIRHLERNIYRVYLESPKYMTLSGSADTKNLTISKAFRLVRIEWSFDDTTAKDLNIVVKHPHQDQLSKPTELIDLDDDIHDNGYATFGEEYEFEGGAVFTITVTGTASKLFSPTFFLQALGRGLID